MLENHTFDKKPPGDHRLAVLLNTRGTDVFSFELDKQKRHFSGGVSLNCPGKDYLLAIRGTDVDPHVLDLPESKKQNFGITSVCEHNDLKTIRSYVIFTHKF
ncbi:hypothetical protein AVEN_117402-1 [Araneus ventricosus]|uniref:Uncharacterized protein n=1 Tax=Araneus ventricosus TaxID=182803 RepID=A0A4Y2E792_ARAVE|nr:hypothetical protein AVEN_117402-1 [Araneus ventricosus]